MLLSRLHASYSSLSNSSPSGSRLFVVEPRFKQTSRVSQRAHSHAVGSAENAHVVADCGEALQQAVLLAQDGLGRALFEPLQFDAKVDKDVAKRLTPRVGHKVDHGDERSRRASCAARRPAAIQRRVASAMVTPDVGENGRVERTGTKS